MKVALVTVCLYLVLEFSHAITVKPSKKLQITENSHSDVKKSPQNNDRIVRYVPYLGSRHQLDNSLNFVRYLQSLPKTNAPIPSIAYLYGNKEIRQPPHIQSGFIYKARPETSNKDSYQTATMYPIFNRPAPQENHQQAKYHQVYQQQQKHVVPLSKVKQYTPFSPANKVPGEWQPITITKSNGYIKGQVYDDYIRQFSLTNEEPNGEFFPITKQPLKHVTTAYPTVHPTKNFVKSNTKAIKMLNPTAIYEQHEKPLIYTTTSKPITISTAKPVQSIEDSYEFEEQLIYELRPSFDENKTLHELPKQQHHEYDSHPQHLNYQNEELTTIQYEIESSSENIKPHLNFTHITPVPNVLEIYKPEKGHHHVEINDAENDYYDKDINDSDYDDVIRDGSPKPNSGRPGIDYPIFHDIPETQFSCKEQRYKGFFGDPETRCQVWHYCDLNGGKSSFLCPNGTIFSQNALTCDWWFNVKCSTTAQLYVLNERLYKYILPFTPKFPQDFQGPLVDKYLALKFKEMEEEYAKEREEKTAIETTTIESEREDAILVSEQIKQEERISDTTDNTVDGASDAHSENSKEIPQHFVAEKAHELEADVEIHNFGTSGHLSPLSNQNLDS